MKFSCLFHRYVRVLIDIQYFFSLPPALGLALSLCILVPRPILTGKSARVGIPTSTNAIGLEYLAVITILYQKFHSQTIGWVVRCLMN